MDEEMTDQRSNIWWKLTPLAAVLTVLTWLVLMYIKFEEPELSLWHLLPIYVGLWLPNAYLSTFALWHWKTRYQGRWPFAWAIAFVLWWAYLPGLAYFLSYILPELRGKDPYSKPPEALVLPDPLPQKYRYLKSAFFIIGSFLVLWGLFATVVVAIAHWCIVPVFNDAIPQNIPEKFSQETGSALLMFSTSVSVMFTTVAISGMATALGAILLYFSQRIRWRLLDEKEKEII
jgi:hypothetical protein